MNNPVFPANLTLSQPAQLEGLGDTTRPIVVIGTTNNVEPAAQPKIVSVVMCEAASEPNLKDILVAAFCKSVEKAQAIQDQNLRRLELRRLYCGSIKRSRVVGVDSADKVRALIRNLGELDNSVQYPETKNEGFIFPVPRPYRAYTPMSRVKDLVRRGGVYADAIHLCGIKGKDNTWEYKLHAPKIYPVEASELTFILDKNREFLVEWFAGEDVSCSTVTGDVGTHWVHLDVDLVAENMKNKRK